MKVSRRKSSGFKRFMAYLLSACLSVSLVIPTSFAAGEVSSNSNSFSPNAAWSGIAEGDILVKDTITQITNGVVEHEVVANTPAGNDQKIDYMCVINLSDTIKLAAGYGQDDASSWSLVSTTDQAAAYEANHPGETVVAAINADFFNMGTGQPMGALVMEGTVYHEANNRWYFAILKDGTPVIRNSADLSDCEMAVGGLVPLVKDGEVVPANYSLGSDDYSRCTIGIMEDGSIVTSVTHGRLSPISCGRTYQEIAEMYQRAGCVDALVLDGGGSATYAARIEGSDTLEVRNSPSDGAEREVSSSILVVSTAEPTGVFDHAALTPNNELYTPGYEVQFEASGVDTAGFTTNLPENVQWALAEDSEDMGTIDPTTGLFTAGDQTGVVTVLLQSDGETVGSTTIEIAVPDHIYFNSEEVSLGFEAVTDFGIVVRNKDRDINCKDGDLIWTSTVEGLGTFDGNLFTANEENSLSGNVTATSAYDPAISGTIHVIVGMLPTLVWDFEDYVDEETGDVTSAEEYYTGSNGILNHSNYARGGKESIEIVSIDDDEPVRFGEKSLKLNFDFTDCGAVTEGACIGTTEAMEIPGSPTGIGVWVYAPEGVGVTYDGTVSGLWLRGYVLDGAGNVMPYDFTLEPKNTDVQNSYDEETNTWTVQPGIYWEGWMYLEADLTSLNGPFSIQRGMTFRLMFVAGTGMVGTQRTGSIYFDNLQFVYGTNVDDTDNPVIDSIRFNDVELEDGAVLDTDTVNVNAYFHDVENKYTTGIDTSTVRMYVDGVNVVDNEAYEYALEPDGSIAHLYNLALTEGQHSITVSLRDGFGNETSETRYFVVDTGAQTEQTTVSVAPVESAAVLGGTVNLEIRASGTDVETSSTQLRLGSQFTDYQVTFAEGYEGSSSYSNLSGTLTVDAQRETDAMVEDGLIATVTVSVPSTLTASSSFTYTVKGGSYTTTSGFYATYSAPEASLPVDAPYTISASTVIVGQEATIKVADQSGNPVAGVGIYLADTDEKIGETDENGAWVTGYFSAAAGTTGIYAKDADGLLSFQYKVSSYDDAGESAPYGILFNAVNDGTSQKSISWFTSTQADEQSITYAVSGTDEWTTVPAQSVLRTFTAGGNSAALVNSVTLTGLSSDTTYEYRVGGGESWSETGTFTTASASDKSVDFFVLGDIQAEDTTNISSIMSILKSGDYDFGIQTGDAVDDAAKYEDWVEVADLFSAATLGDMDIVHVLGNHEYAGDATSATASAVFNLPEAKAGSYYSVTYGCVYMAVINYTGTGAQLREALDWLVQDAQASDATWKVLCMHQPAYYTNASGGNGEIYNSVPDAVEEAGINVVFSGHDHALARTNQLTDDEIDTDSGILYYICGSSGEKSYSITSQNIFDFDTIFALATQDFTATYLTASADKNNLTIRIYDLDKGLMDSVTLDSVCVKQGHSYLYDPETGCAVCTRCGETDEAYTGELQDASGNGYYLLAGTLQKGWIAIGEETCYFNPNTGIKEEVIKTTDVPTTCTQTGYYILTAASGATKRYSYANAPGHEYVEQEDGSHVCSVCGHVRVELSDCTITLPFTKATYSGTAKTPYPTVVAPDGTELEGGSVDFYVNYSNNINVGVATVTVTAKSGYNTNLTDFRGDYGGSVQLYFTIVPDLPTGLAVTEGETGCANLTWNASASADTYLIYQSAAGGAWKKIGTTDDTSFAVTGLSANTTYQFRVRAQAEVDGVTYSSISYTDPVELTTGQGTDISGFTVIQSWKTTVYSGSAKTYAVASLTVMDENGNELTRNTDYVVTYRDNVNAGTASVIITGTGQYQGEIIANFTIVPRSLTNETANIDDTAELTYTGNAVCPPVLIDGLTEGTDFSVEYQNNVEAGTATALITGLGNYTGTKELTFQIQPTDLSQAEITDRSIYIYTGSEILPDLKVVGANGALLTEGKDYEIASVKNNVGAGTAYVTIRGIGNYTGEATHSFTIQEQGVAVFTITVTDGTADLTTAEAGSTVTITANSKSGYTFQKWEVISGTVTLADAAAETTTFTMPAENVAVKATYTENSSSGGDVGGGDIGGGDVGGGDVGGGDVGGGDVGGGDVGGGDIGGGDIGGGSSGGGSVGTSTFAITVDSVSNGTVTVDPKSAAEDTTVTITVNPNKGYTLETVVVTDANGNELKLTRKSDTEYTFVMPAGKVTVTATFMDDNTMLNYFVDVQADDYFYDAVLWAVENGVTSGTSATTFGPNATCTRAQAVTFLWRAAGSPDPKSEINPFTDVKDDDYYHDAVLWAVENGITSGTSATTFSPDAHCTRAQIVTFLWRAEKSPAAGSKNPFVDVAADAYYVDAVKWAVENGITSGTSDTTFSPDADCTRSQIVTFLYQCFNK